MKLITEINKDVLAKIMVELYEGMYGYWASSKPVSRVELKDGRIAEIQMIITTDPVDFMTED